MKIVSIINTSGIVYDDRLVKEAESILDKRLNYSIVAFEKKNEKSTGKFKGRIEYKTLRLFTRKWYPEPKRFLALKAIEYHLHLFKALLQSRGAIIWAHNMEMWGLVILAILLKKIGYLDGVIWDQHELPPDSLFKKKWLRNLFNWTCENSDVVVSANQPRTDFLLKHFPKLSDKIEVINNYPTDEIIYSPKRDLPEELEIWLNGDQYALFQGSARKDRKIIECIKAVGEIENLRLVIVGPMDVKIKEEITTLIDNFDEKVYSTGMVIQDDLYIYIDNCLLSLVFYGNIDANHWLCEPNRFYQALCRKKPIVSGANPPMKSIIEQFSCGYSVSDDGNNPDEIADAIRYVVGNKAKIQTNVDRVHSDLTWSANNDSFDAILSRFQRSN